MHTTIGNIGHLLTILSFVTSLVAVYAYAQVTTGNTLQTQSWRRFARGAFYLHAFAVLGVVICLFTIIYNHYFEYHYAWNYSSRTLPTEYVIACFWNGQEGSFLLWIFWHVLLGLALIHTNKTWEAPVMTVFALVQAFLASMILGVVIPGLDIKIGSSPFMLLRDALPNTPIFQTNPNFVPEDGNGLNPLLQNYWMVIHPPTLFLGFAATIVPFAFCIAGLWRKQYAEWIRPALPWTLFAALILGAGILMGAYWAYETLNFGGYWNWDPVENAVYVPWLVLVAAIHTMIAHRKNGTALRTTIVLVIATFSLILYSTFLTRSGILGDASVHSFTDLGLSGQLLIYLGFFTLGAIVLAAKEWKHIPASEREVTVYSREFWIFMGATVLCLAGFQVIVSTSIPVYNAIIEAFGGISNVAPPADQVAHYTKFQLWFAVTIVLLTAFGQFVWWRKVDSRKRLQALTAPLLIALLISALLIAVAKIDNLIYIVLLTAAVFSIVANINVSWSVVRKNAQLSGGAVAHVGVALMLIGIMFSSGYSKVVSLNYTGLLISNHESFTKDDNRENKENTVLFINDPEQISNYRATYRGRRVEARGVPGYIDPVLLTPGNEPNKMVAKQDIVQTGNTYFRKGDTLTVSPENIYFEVEYRDEKGRVFSTYPRVQINSMMGEGGYVFSPDIKREVGRDIYSYVSVAPNLDGEKEWSKAEEYKAQIGDTLIINDYIAVLENVLRVTNVEGMELTENDAAVQAHLRILGDERDYQAKPTYVIKDRMVGRIPEEMADLGLRVTFASIDPQTGTFTFEVNTTQKDHIILKALEKPYINVLWIGTGVLMLGFALAIVRRYKDFYKMQHKPVATEPVDDEQLVING